MTGIFLSILIALISMGLSSLHPSLDSLVLSIILGMLTGNIFEKRAFLESGLNICIRFGLPAGIILYGSQLMINVKDISHLVLVPPVFIFTFAITFLVSRTLRINRQLSLLLSIRSFYLWCLSNRRGFSPHRSKKRGDIPIHNLYNGCWIDRSDYLSPLLI